MPVEDIIEVRANAARIAPIMAEAEMLDRAQVFVDARPAAPVVKDEWTAAEGAIGWGSEVCRVEELTAGSRKVERVELLEGIAELCSRRQIGPQPHPAGIN